MMTLCSRCEGESGLPRSLVDLPPSIGSVNYGPQTKSGRRLFCRNKVRRSSVLPPACTRPRSRTEPLWPRGRGCKAQLCILWLVLKTCYPLR